MGPSLFMLALAWLAAPAIPLGMGYMTAAMRLAARRGAGSMTADFATVNGLAASFLVMGCAGFALPLLVLTALPFYVVGWWGHMMVKRLQQLPAGHCQNCRYDLRGLPEPRCPECGTSFGPGAAESERGP